MRLPRFLYVCLVGLACLVVSSMGAAGASALDAKYNVLEVTGDDVNLRAGPSIDHHDVGQLSRGDLLFELERDDEFVRVRVPGGVPVYVFATLLDVSGGDGDADELPLRCRVNAEDVLMRATPTTGHYPVHDQKLQRGDELIVIGAEDTAKGRWMHVVAPPTVHVWIHQRYVRRADPQPSMAKISARADKRLDQLTGGRTRSERERRAAAAEEDFETRLRTITAMVDEGEYGEDVERAARELAESTQSQELRVRALALAERVIGLRDAQRTVREAAATETAEAEAAERQRRQDAAERKRRDLERQQQLREAERERARLQRERARRNDRGRPTVEGAVRIVGGSALLDTTGNRVVELASTRFRLADYDRKRVRIWGALQQREGRRDRVDVTSIEIVTTER